MSERAELLYDGITGIRDDIVERSENYVFHKKRRSYRGLITWGAMAACACLVVAIALPQLGSGGSSNRAEGVKDNAVMDAAPEEEVEDMEALQKPSMESAVVEGGADFMCLFPSVIPEGYSAWEEGGVYEEAILQAKFYNEELQDEMIIRIASKEWFAEKVGDVEFDCVFYREKPEATGSYIYIDGGAYIVEYSFSTRDIAGLDDFYDMVYSAPFFEE